MQVVSKPRVRQVRYRELEEVGALVFDAFASFRQVLAAHIFKPYVKDAANLTMRWQEANVMVLEQEGRIVGTLTYYADAAREGMGWPSGFAGLRTLAVSPAAQGRGHGRVLCEWCVTRARRQGATALALHTASFMTSACMLYERIGFQRHPSHDLLASEVLGFDPALGHQKIVAYMLQL
ncbi:GNAT family N-acetyltransferase (plasmid) [Aquamicrobium terrae]